LGGKEVLRDEREQKELPSVLVSLSWGKSLREKKGSLGERKEGKLLKLL